MTEHLPKQTLNNTEPKRSVSVVVSDNKTRFKTWFKPLIQLDKKKDYEIALINLETYYSLQNIDNSNNCFTYMSGANALWSDIIISEGCYHVEDTNEFIQREMIKNCHYDKANDKDNIEISANTNTLNSEMILKNNYENDFRQDKSINSLPGFHSKLYISGFNESENMVNILTIYSILVNINIISVVMSTVSHNPQFYSFYHITFSDLHVEDVIALTNSQLHRLVETYEEKKGMKIRM